MLNVIKTPTVLTLINLKAIDVDLFGHLAVYTTNEFWLEQRNSVISGLTLHKLLKQLN